MKTIPKLILIITFSYTVILCFSTAQAQNHPGVRPGVSVDWTRRHLLFSPGASASARARFAATQEFRLYEKWLTRTRQAVAASRRQPNKGRDGSSSNVNVDWNMPLGNATSADGVYPALFVSDFEHASCSDWIVFGLDTPSSTGQQANLVAFTNLYVSGVHGSGTSGICEAPGAHTDPTVKFALSISTQNGVIKTSPVVSVTGDKLAFVESAGRQGTIFHVLTVDGSTGGSPTAAAAPIHGTLVDVVLSTTSDDTMSSPWVDYANDIAYVATDDGVLHKITGVFLGIPAEVNSGPWPLQLAPGQTLTSPVADFDSGKIFAAASDGKLYSVACVPAAPANSTSCSVTSSAAVVAPDSIFDPPVLDSGNQRLYWFSNNDGGDDSQPVLVQTDLNLAVQSVASLVIGQPGANNRVIRAGTFDNDFYNTGSGNLWACGLTHIPEGLSGGLYPTLLRFSVNGGTLTTHPNASLMVSHTNHDACSSPTEVFNGTTDMFFVGTGMSGIVGDTTCTIGCMQSFTFAGGNIVRLAVAPESGLSSGIVVDNTDLSSPQAASIYFAPQGARRAVKLTQSGLQ